MLSITQIHKSQVKAKLPIAIQYYCKSKKERRRNILKILIMDDDVKTKALIAVAIFLVGFLSASAPLKIINVDGHVFSAGNLMASGVLLSAGLVHLLPKSIEILQFSSLGKIFPPVAPFITGLTFCLFLILEECLHMHFDDHPFMTMIDSDGDRGETNSSSNSDNDNHSHKHIHTTHHRERNTNANNEVDPLLVPLQDNHKYYERTSSNDTARTSSNESLMLMPISCAHDIESGAGTAPLESFRSKTFGQEHQHHHNAEHVAKHIHGSILASVILLFALSIHSIFDGLAIGVSSKTNEVVSVTVAVLAHKGFAGYALGSSMVASEMGERRYFILVLVFSSCSVIGIILGTAFEQMVATGNSSTTVGVIQAIVAGTFLYVSIVEIGLRKF